MAEEPKSKGPAETGSFSEDIEVTLMRGTDKLFQVSKRVSGVNSLLKAFQMDYCPSCGEKPTPLIINFCTACGERYLVRVDPKTGRSIIVPMGKEKLPKGLKL